jgi:hypothetical protein
MTPKEKAKELVEKIIFQIKYNTQPSTVQFVAKQCALIVVDEIIKSNKNFFLGHTNDYWQEVQQEIENI